MNVLFLDYDGVVNTPMWNEDGTRCTYNFPEDNKVNNFQACQWISEFCQKYDYNIVVTSTWRRSNNYKDCLINGGLRTGVKILDKTPDLHYRDYGYRGEEIQAYLDEHDDIENFIIVDDDSDMGNLIDHLIHCDTWEGFTMKQYDEAVTLHGNLKITQSASEVMQ